MKNTTVSLNSFINDYCKVLDLSEFTDTFFGGSVTDAASAFNVSRQTYYNWLSSDDYQVETVYFELPNGDLTHDYVLSKRVKRVGAANPDKLKKVGYVYAVSDGNITKIGSSTRPQERIKSVARELGFDSGYSSFVSNVTSNYRVEESACHKSLEHLKRENTIYQREVFSCSISDAEKVICSIVKGCDSGICKTLKGSLMKVDEVFK
ncbi:hypothetical protein BOX08_gp44 [Pseudoalteromonas phage BS5]|uniref:hypothetical protein n=1 Tax=Pseudoalteromonas phage BS5 TaxID=1874539 RepID=UPI00081994FB|nr:hypothetical protein BOX08_gp44 [Pseudoalteromonas phage BS5]ANY29609.1 hypothetical protein [Pseudoalteromonas phage BS5]